MTEPEKRRQVRLYGQPQSAEAYALRDYLQRSVVTFDWIEITSDADCRQHLGLPDARNVRLPVVELPDGRRLFGPTLREVADSLRWYRSPSSGNTISPSMAVARQAFPRASMRLQRA